jgi:hypothetical protein
MLHLIGDQHSLERSRNLGSPRGDVKIAQNQHQLTKVRHGDFVQTFFSCSGVVLGLVAINVTVTVRSFFGIHFGGQKIHYCNRVKVILGKL